MSVKRTVARLVEENHAAEGSKPPYPVAVERVLPREIDVRDPARDDDEVERPVPHDLIGNVDVAALGVTGFGTHADTLAPSIVAGTEMSSTRGSRTVITPSRFRCTQ
jgi:hypothetical protein